MSEHLPTPPCFRLEAHDVWCIVSGKILQNDSRQETTECAPNPRSNVTVTGITSSFVDSGGDNANFLADVGETIRWEHPYLQELKI